MKILKWVVIVIAVLFVGAQVVRPAMTNPAIDQSQTIESKAMLTPEVSAILNRSCKDCHSNSTTWPWYSKVAPVSWYLAHDVVEGRKEVNLSNWGAYDARRAGRKLGEMCEQVTKGDMPPKQYLLIHTDAKLSDADKKALCAWTEEEQKRVQTGSTGK